MWRYYRSCVDHHSWWSWTSIPRCSCSRSSCHSLRLVLFRRSLHRSCSCSRSCHSLRLVLFRLSLHCSVSQGRGKEGSKINENGSDCDGLFLFLLAIVLQRGPPTPGGLTYLVAAALWQHTTYQQKTIMGEPPTGCLLDPPRAPLTFSCCCSHHPMDGSLLRLHLVAVRYLPSTIHSSRSRFSSRRETHVKGCTKDQGTYMCHCCDPFRHNPIIHNGRHIHTKDDSHEDDEPHPPL